MMCPTFEWCDIIPWTLIILGWIIINHQHNARETRKERKAELDRVIDKNIEGTGILTVKFTHRVGKMRMALLV